MTCQNETLTDFLPNFVAVLHKSKSTKVSSSDLEEKNHVE